MISKSDLTPEKKKRFEGQRIHQFIVTANGTTHTTEEVTAYVYDLDMFVGGEKLLATLRFGEGCKNQLRRRRRVSDCSRKEDAPQRN